MLIICLPTVHTWLTIIRRGGKTENHVSKKKMKQLHNKANIFIVSLTLYRNAYHQQNTTRANVGNMGQQMSGPDSSNGKSIRH